MPKTATADPFNHDEWLQSDEGPLETISLRVLKDHRYGTTFPTQKDEDGDPEYKPKGKARPIAVFKAGTIVEIPADLALRLLRDLGPKRTKAEIAAGREVKFRAVDQDAIDRLLDEREQRRQERDSEARLSMNDSGDGMPLMKEAIAV